VTDGPRPGEQQPSSLLDDFTPVGLRDVEAELSRLMKAAQAPSDAPVIQARLSNLVVFCDDRARARGIAGELPSILAAHPARVLLLLVEPGTEPGDVSAAVRVQGHRLGSQQVCSEQILLTAREGASDRLPFAVRSLLIGDLPTNLWWASLAPPALVGPLLFELGEYAQQLIYDSVGWLDPIRGVAATSSWLSQFERTAGQGRWRVASDLNWRRLKSWRRMLGQALDPASAPGASSSVSELLVEHGPHAVVQAWELVGWLSSRLGWHVQAGRVDPNVELSWQVRTAGAPFALRIRRLAEGPPEVRRVRLACELGGGPGALDVTIDEEWRLAVAVEGVGGGAPRTMSVQRPSLASLVSRQLSDRAPDPVFLESMAVAQVFAQGLLA
jgi:glucose-6-phosphate dehydrogenase assembly protein OpcA